MRRIILLLPVLFATAAVGFILYRNLNLAEAISVSSSAETIYLNAADNNYAGSVANIVPKDIFYTQAVKSVVFSHQTHAVDLGFKCDTCHGSLFQMKAGNVESQPDFNMKGLAEGKYCGSCHSSSNHAAFSTDTQCARCHSGVKGLERAAEAGTVQED